MLFDASLVTSIQPQSLIAQIVGWQLDAVVPTSRHPRRDTTAGSEMDISTRDAVSPVVMTRCVTPANRPLQHLEAGQLGASTPQHVTSRPSVPDLCIASENLLSLIDPYLWTGCRNILSQLSARGRRSIATIS